ncbi:MAG: ribonuclease R family protein, partial [Cyanobacteria bacterium P01_H01_bin.121]
MKFPVTALLANFSEDKLVAPKALEKKLSCEDESELEQLQVTLDALEKVGVLAKERGKYRRIFEEDCVEGRLRCSSKGFCFAIQDDEEAEDVYIRECHLNHAWNGDRVLVKITKEGGRRRSPEGSVKLIIERANTSVLARVKAVEEKFHAVPLDDRLLFEVLLQTNGIDLQAAIDHLVNVELLRYPIGQHPPKGSVTHVLGSDAEAASDIDIVCCKHNLPGKFSAAALKAADGLPNKVRKAELKRRVDLRDYLTIAVHVGAAPQDDSATGEVAEGDNMEPIIDSAISLLPIEAGGWQIMIHTADAAYYVPPDSPLDAAARQRGTTVYLGATVLPLLPPELSHHLCSLTEGEDRLAVSLTVTIDADGQVQEYRLEPSVIQVDFQVTYAQAQAALDRQTTAEATEAEDDEELEALAPTFNLLDTLMEMSQKLRERRAERGAFEFNLPEHQATTQGPNGSQLGSELFSRFSYNDEGSLGAMLVASRLPIRSVLAEIMILANHLVASHVQALQVPALFRIHRPPEPIQVQDLVKLLSNMDMELEFENEETVEPVDYQHFLKQFAASSAERVLT